MTQYVEICAMTSFKRKGMCQFITNGGFGNIKVVGWEGKQLLNLRFNLLARLGFVTKKDAMLVSQRALVASKQQD